MTSESMQEFSALKDNLKVGVIGLGYVGLPLCLEFGKKFPSLGFDVNESRVSDLNVGVDKTGEASVEEIEGSELSEFTSDPRKLGGCNFFVVTVPTPIDENKEPDMSYLISASTCIAGVLKKGDCVVYESTVYPGATEEICLPILEEASGLKLNDDFWLGYSPERINPGDKNHRLKDIVKVTSGSCPEAAHFVDEVYREIIIAGTHKAGSIKVAEAAKVIENTQRDLNIALVNELSMIFHKMEIDTHSVLEAARTKWNFLDFKPGLVGGHCIGVDPYYLTDKAMRVGHHPEVVLAGRKTNDGMGSYVVDRIAELVRQKGERCSECRAILLGLTFKPDCPDLRNTKIVDVYKGLLERGVQVDVYDPLVDPEESSREYDIRVVDSPDKRGYQIVVLGVGHRQFKTLRPLSLGPSNSQPLVCFDIPGMWPVEVVDGRL